MKKTLKNILLVGMLTNPNSLLGNDGNSNVICNRENLDMMLEEFQNVPQ